MSDEPAGPTLETWQRGDGIDFADEDAKADYQRRAKRMVDALRGADPDRVPVNLLSTFYPVFHAGYTPEEAMYEGEKLQDSLLTFVDDLEPDLFPWAASLIPSATALEIVDYQGFDWPGDGSSPETVYQAREREYMGVEDYEDFFTDPSDFFIRQYLPEVFGELDGMAHFPQFSNLTAGIAGVHPYLLPFGMPPMRETLQNLLDAGEEAMRWQQLIGGTVEEIVGAGYPQSVGGITLAPYDMLGDMVRGTHAIMMDLKRRPETLLEAVDRLVPIAIEMGITSAHVNNNPFVFIPLHKGADGFMSGEEFETFYWPQLRQVIEALTEADLVPWLFAEGRYTSRLETISDLPEGEMIWHFQDTDLELVRETLPEYVTIAGDVSTGLLNTREPEAVTEYSQDLIERMGRNRFVLSPGVGLDEAKPENVKAMMDAPKNR
ncbi:uroporphyrinogen decarboxylase family protein [Halodesulfurarchaeum sp. HSR-GB]|uniref:uroporphyrinogen decarboxylase family protein n=1 Tax=Halodesulfurarchaeum sp. HSR-GB TaxID=3074077 RepID=UPI002866473A|nr:uroporphyrinogen decarboxylase family protein [Halodesulfurarchaeum sp. HSR-GB]MDR5656527.1 uroporphyrinogen decarboxylase family protein [Halodesulfurarchaeum sp. HSR-GB]